MPTKPGAQPKVADVKTRKITDYWGKSDAGSSPQSTGKGGSDQITPMGSSPIKQSGTNHSTPFRTSHSLFSAGVMANNAYAGLNVGPPLNIFQPSPSSRKYILISSDDDDSDPEPKMSVSKKRPRENAPPGPATVQTPQASHQSIPEVSTRAIPDITRSPPRKKRVIEAVASGSHSRTASSCLSGYSSHPELSPITPSSPQDSHFTSLGAVIASNAENTSDATLTQAPTRPFSSVGTSTASSLSSQELRAPKENPQDKVRSKIEEIRKLAQAKHQANQMQTGTVYHPIVLDDSDGSDDPLEKLFPTKKSQPTTSAKPGPASTSQKQAPAPSPADASDSSSSITESESDGPSMGEPSTPPNRPNVTTRSRSRTASRAASRAPEPPPPKRAKVRASSKTPMPPRLPPPRSRAASKSRATTPVLPPPPSRTRAASKSRATTPVLPPPPSRPRAASKSRATTPALPSSKASAKVTHNPLKNSIIPSSLASLLEESPSSYRRPDDLDTRELVKAVKRDMMDIERRHLYGDTMEAEPPENHRRIDPSVTEMALGEEDGKKMNEVLASDNAMAAQISPWRPFWNEQLVGAREASMDVEYQIPPLSLSNVSHPILKHLYNLVAHRDTDGLALFLSSGALLAIPPGVEEEILVPWLFLLACEGPDHVANAAHQSLRGSLSRYAGTHPGCHQVIFSNLMVPILSLGPLEEAIAPLRCSEMAITPPRDPITRNVVVNRLVNIIAMTRGMLPQNPENVVLLLLLLYLDPSTVNDVRRDISLVVEDIIASFTSHLDDGERMKALVVCKMITETTFNFRTVEKKVMLDCVFGGQAGPRNFMRWLAVGFLLPEAVRSLEWHEFVKPPPLDRLAHMLTPSHMATSPFRIWSGTNYHDLHNCVDILGTILTDIDLYEATEDAHIERIMSGLMYVHGKIADARAAFIHRTRVKDALHRLKLRVYFQFQRTTKQPKRVATIENMLKR